MPGMNSDSPAPAAAARRLRRAIRAALLQRAAWGARVFGLLLAGGAFFALRVAVPSLAPLSLLPWAALPVGALFAAVGREPCVEFIDMPEKLKGKYQYHTEAEMGKLRAAGCDVPFRPLEDAVRDYVETHLSRF